MVSAGRILILPQGTWDNATMYNMLDLVAYNGISWLCKRQCVGITPSVTATEYWQQFGSSAPIASTTVAGLVMPDGQTITINTTTGAIAVPTATAAALGLVKVDGTSITIDQNGVISSAGGNLSNLGDVAITSLANGQVLIWNQTNQKWQNGTIAGALSALSDVTITSATDEQILVYDSTAQKWKNATAQATLSNSTKPVQTAVVKKALTDVVETVGAGASQAYSEGDIILGNDGTYYKATTDIAQNTTLTVGGNIQATNNRALITNLTQNLDKVMNNFILSTSEKEVGEDTDGSKIYSKTYRGTTQPTDGQIIDSALTSSNIKWIRVMGSVNFGGTIINIPIAYWANNQQYRFMTRLSATGLALIIDGWTSGVTMWHLTAEYVKNN